MDALMEFFDHYFECDEIVLNETCDTFRLGVVVNIIFFILAVAVTILLHIALKSNKESGGKILEELYAQGIHIGYTLYMISGGAFYGAVEFSKVVVGRHTVFGFTWPMLLLLLLLIEMTKAKVKANSDVFPNEFSFTRKLVIPISFLYLYWLWIGADIGF